MKNQIQIAMFLLLTVTGLCNAADKPEISYYKSGDVGAFSVKMPMPEGVNPTDVILTPLCESKKVYLLYTGMAAANQMQQALQRRSQRGQLTDAQVKRRKALQEEADQIRKRIDATAVSRRQGRITAMEGILHAEQAQKTESQVATTAGQLAARPSVSPRSAGTAR